jgi:hypothetical protein
MSLLTAIPLVTEPGRVGLFECAKCDKVEFVLET